jgi:RNA-directed DNA polymerase
MKETKTGAKGSQLRKEGFTQKASAEHEGYAGVHNPARITETDDANTNRSEDKLLEKIVEPRKLE